jgi:hypothetical protein
MARVVARACINVTLHLPCLSRTSYPELLCVQPHHCKCHSAISESDWRRLWLSYKRLILWEVRRFSRTGISHKKWLKFDTQGNFVRIPEQFKNKKTLNYTLTSAAVNKEIFECRFDFLTGALLEDSGVFKNDFVQICTSVYRHMVSRVTRLVFVWFVFDRASSV